MFPPYVDTKETRIVLHTAKRVALITLPEVVSTPDTLGGKPRIQGRRIAVQHIVVWHDRMGMSEADIAREFSLTPREIAAAFDYYRSHREEIDDAIRADAAADTEMQQRSPSMLQAKLRDRSGG